LPSCHKIILHSLPVLTQFGTLLVNMLHLHEGNPP
jgi:hypothetical protein